MMFHFCYDLFLKLFPLPECYPQFSFVIPAFSCHSRAGGNPCIFQPNCLCIRTHSPSKTRDLRQAVGHHNNHNRREGVSGLLLSFFFTPLERGARRLRRAGCVSSFHPRSTPRNDGIMDVQKLKSSPILRQFF